MARGDLPEQWALPLHTMPDALNDVAQTQAQTQATMNSMAGFLKSQSAAIVNMRAEAEVAKQERETMMGMLDALKNELGAVRAELDEGWAELGHVPSAAELERAVRERCVKEVAKEVGKSHRAMLVSTQQSPPHYVSPGIALRYCVLDRRARRGGEAGCEPSERAHGDGRSSRRAGGRHHRAAGGAGEQV